MGKGASWEGRVRGIISYEITARFGKKKFDFRIQIETDDVVYSGRLTEESCRRYILDVHTATNRQNWAMCELVIPVSVNVSF